MPPPCPPPRPARWPTSPWIAGRRTFLRYIDGLEMLPTFDGHANCFIESGFGKGLLIDFNYDVEPLPGRYPLPGIGPFTLLQESEMNHWGKMMFRWMYWNILLKGQELPLPARMTMAGKWHGLRRLIWISHSADLNQKIDTLTAQVAYLTEQAQIAERQRQDRAELMSRSYAHRQRGYPPDDRAAGGGPGIRRPGRPAAPAEAPAAQRAQPREDARPARELLSTWSRPSGR